jgi:8-oxo-dGTP pyrophosphatase MutT (NUDIX family)
VKPSAVRDVYVVARRGDDILMLLRSGTGYMDGFWGPPSGKVEEGETYLAAAVRELEEETGLRVAPDDFRFIHVVERMPDSGAPWLGIFFEVAVSSEPTNRELHKHSDMRFFPSSALPPNTVDYFAHVVWLATAGTAFSVWNF